MAQIKDVAKQAGVSVASVSRVMAGHAGVSEATRQRVLDAVQGVHLNKRHKSPIGFRAKAQLAWL